MVGAADEEFEVRQRFLFFNVVPSWMVSFMTHVALIILLALLMMPEKKDKDVALTASANPTEALETIDLNLEEMEMDSEAFENEFPDEVPMDSEIEDMVLPEAEVDFGTVLGAEDFSLEDTDFSDLSAADMSDETSSRTGDSREKLLKEYGGNSASEEAVALALKWIVNHQLEDGGWNFDHRIGPGKHRNSPNPGTLVDARAGATAMALLPLLGNGQTHQVGQYKKEVAAGLEFLMSRAKKGGRGISYLESGGSMYSHGLVAITFCEAFAMTKDPALAPYAQGTIWFIEDAQDPRGGGWRYTMKQPGDTSAVGWQLMALKSAKLSGLDMNPKTYRLAEKFLDSVSTTNGAFYGYTGPPLDLHYGHRGRTAIGLLCRMYMGWEKDRPGMQEGMKWISDRGPDVTSSGNMYYNYYATQAVKHYGGRTWNDWNVKMRDYLVNSQNKEGNTAGSWMFGDEHASEKGGRLYNTSLACMTLEIYYRYLPLYGDKAASDEFPLD
jgi:hypothetical protein